ncbi:hypothetical protein QR680_012377 [Steinernema hermaphroditum]|uniref:FYVE-type domain-containing protein n=1 Tax=Steinernema hermaphroditum TaxID=289476 RepID=A0AA39LZR4_9BILA|nr:hypothetical protein QR680_012377 [Steinernema hermaphroditum]
MDCVLPDMDDLLDQLEASVAGEAPPTAVRPLPPESPRRSSSPSTCSSVSGADSEDEAPQKTDPKWTLPSEGLSKALEAARNDRSSSRDTILLRIPNEEQPLLVSSIPSVEPEDLGDSEESNADDSSVGLNHTEEPFNGPSTNTTPPEEVSSSEDEEETEEVTETLPPKVAEVHSSTEEQEEEGAVEEAPIDELSELEKYLTENPYLDRSEDLDGDLPPVADQEGDSLEVEEAVVTNSEAAVGRNGGKDIQSAIPAEDLAESAVETVEPINDIEELEPEAEDKEEPENGEAKEPKKEPEQLKVEEKVPGDPDVESETPVFEDEDGKDSNEGAEIGEIQDEMEEDLDESPEDSVEPDSENREPDAEVLSEEPVSQVEFAQIEEAEETEELKEEEASPPIVEEAKVGAEAPPLEGDPQEGEEESSRKRSVIASTHDISVETEGRLTESELLLGKVKPYWIPDEECSHCMLCEAKFNVLNRRHHCRACGRVLCGKCCSSRRVLAYMADQNAKQRVCEPCLKTLERIEKYETENGGTVSNGVAEEETESPADGSAGSSTAPSEGDQQPRATKSVLKVRKSATSEDPSIPAEAEEPEGPPRVPKRSVTFLDGVNPGDGGEELLPAEAVARAASANSSKPKKKSVRRALSAHRMREMRIEEEPICLFTGGSTVFVPKDDGTLEPTDVTSVEDEMASGLPVVVALKRNLYALVQICELTCCNQGRVMCVSSRGLAGIGADEVVFVFEHPKGAEARLPSDVLKKLDEIYLTCLDPLNSSADEKVGIRMVRERMLKLFRVDCGTLCGFDVSRILLFRPTHQCLEHLPLPSTPFYFACFIQHRELVWSLALPKRILYKIGFQSSCFPTAIVNKWNRETVYPDEDYESSILKVFTDFRNFNYRLTSILGSTVSLEDGVAVVEIPTWAAERLAGVVNANRNMIAWAADLDPDADSILVCEQDTEGGSFKTSIFAKDANSRRVTGCSFVIFDGALKSSDEPMSVSIVEDGIVIRLRSTVMSELVEKLLAGSDFELESKAMKLAVRWVKSAFSEESAYTIRSPIDGMPLEEQWQYGALLSRQLRSLMPLQSATEWSLRLATVVNIFEDKFPTTFQSKIFSICEEVAKLVAASLSPFISILVENNVRSIAMRIQLSQESAEYQTALWPGLDDIHAVWIVTLDDQVAPILFNICSHVTSSFCAELHMPILSTRPLPEIPSTD